MRTVSVLLGNGRLPTSTVVRTHDGRLVLSPGPAVHSGIVTVQAGYEQVRSTISLAIDVVVEVGARLLAAMGGGGSA